MKKNTITQIVIIIALVIILGILIFFAVNTNSKLSTQGVGSPIIYSTGDITLEESEGTSNGS